MFYSTMSRRHTVSHPPPYGSPNAGYGIAVEADCSTQWSCAASRGSDDDHNDNRGPSSYYYKDKPPKRHPPFRLDLSDPWTLASLAGLLVFVWAMHARAQRAWILKELHVQSFDEAIRVFQSVQAQQRKVRAELEEHYELSDKLLQRDSAWKEQMEHLQNATKKESHRAVIDK